MDYEKKYNEALERFKSFKEKYYTKDTSLGDVIFDKTGKMQKDFESIFPQLRESEDERHRKWILEYLYDGLRKADEQFKDHFKSAIDWLEKQKESNYTKRNALFDKCVKNCDPEVMKEVSDKVDEMLRKSPVWNSPIMTHEMIMKEQKEQHIPWYDYQKSKEAGYTIVPNEEYEQLIKQKEQKPALSEVELLFRGEKVTLKRPFYRDNKGRGYSTTEQDEETAWNALRAWCEKKGISLYDLYPKAEWSEEDAKMLDAMIDIVSGSFYEPLCPRKEMLTWLKSLRPQPKQEWSEEDEIHVRSIFGDFRQDVVPDEEDQDWLKKKLESLRPSWKPSEEQMEALKWLVEYVSPSEKYIVIVKNLYEQLKKL